MQATELDLEQVNVEHHRAEAPVYDEMRQHPEIWSPREQRRLHRAVGRALKVCGPASEPVRALDVGAGTGNLARHLLDEGCAVTALDLSSEMLQVLSRKFPGEAESSRLEMVVSSASRLPFGDGAFDLVGCCSVLHHILDYVGAVREMARVLKPGGVLFIDHEGCAERWTGRVHFGHFRLFSRFLAAAPLLPDSTGEAVSQAPAPGAEALRGLLDDTRPVRRFRVDPGGTIFGVRHRAR